MEAVGKLLVMAGLGLVVVGLILWFLAPRGGLPGDVTIRHGNATFFFPVVTCLVVSVVVTLILQLFRR